MVPVVSPSLLFSASKNQFFTLRTAGDLEHTLRACANPKHGLDRYTDIRIMV
jgi:hypothetical protein